MLTDIETTSIRNRKRGAPKAPDVYTLIGKRIRDKRERLGLTQETLAKACGVTFQQVQKYETGFNRIPFDKLITIAVTFSVGLEYFTKGFDNITIKDTETEDYSETGISVRDSRLFHQFRNDNPQAYEKLLELVRSCLKKTRIPSTDNSEGLP